MYHALSEDTRRPEILPLLSLDVDSAKKALHELSSNHGNLLAKTVQDNAFVGKTINARLSSIQKSAEITAPISLPGVATNEVVPTVISFTTEADNSW